MRAHPRAAKTAAALGALYRCSARRSHPPFPRVRRFSLMFALRPLILRRFVPDGRAQLWRGAEHQPSCGGLGADLRRPARRLVRAWPRRSGASPPAGLTANQRDFRGCGGVAAFHSGMRLDLSIKRRAGRAARPISQRRHRRCPGRAPPSAPVPGRSPRRPRAAAAWPGPRDPPRTRRARPASSPPNDARSNR